MKLTALIVLAVIVRVTLDLTANLSAPEDGTIIYREIAGTYQPVGEVGPGVRQFSETFSAVEGGQLPYKVKMFNETGSLFSNEWVGQVPFAPPPPEPCRQKGKSKNCR